MYERFGKAEKLLMRIRALKWQASTLVSSDADASRRDEAVLLVQELSALEAAARSVASEADVAASEARAQALDRRLAELRQ